MALNWRHHATGDLRPCRYCRRPAFMRDEVGRPCHKVCAEQHEHDHDDQGVTLAPVIPLPTPTAAPRRRRIA
ncbi:hypothetical protein [Luedemannella helvata]|uniref:hypothetical protein n=1 Tax=Luedemannella helvata TaxID=349315 RepID=UPI0031E45FEA